MRDPMTPLEREERVLRILANPCRWDTTTKAAYQAQLERVERLRRAALPPATNDTPQAATWHAAIEGAPV